MLIVCVSFYCLISVSHIFVNCFVYFYCLLCFTVFLCKCFVVFMFYLFLSNMDMRYALVYPRSEPLRASMGWGMLLSLSGPTSVSREQAALQLILWLRLVQWICVSHLLSGAARLETCCTVLSINRRAASLWINIDYDVPTVLSMVRTLVPTSLATLYPFNFEKQSLVHYFLISDFCLI